MSTTNRRAAVGALLAIGFIGAGIGWSVVPGPGAALALEPPPSQPQAGATTQGTGLEKKDTSETKLPGHPLELMRKASQSLKDIIDKAEQEHEEFQLKSPFPIVKEMQGPRYYLTALTKMDNRRAELRIKQADVVSHQEWIERTMKTAYASTSSDPDDVAKSVLLALSRRGVDIAMLQKLSGSDSARKAVNLYLESLKIEVGELDQQIKALDEYREIEQKYVRDVAKYDAQDERLRRNIAVNRTLYDSIISKINDYQFSRDLKK